MPDLAALGYAVLPLVVALGLHWLRRTSEVLDIDGVHVAVFTLGACFAYVEGLKGRVPSWGCTLLIMLAVVVALAGLPL